MGMAAKASRTRHNVTGSEKYKRGSHLYKEAPAYCFNVCGRILLHDEEIVIFLTFLDKDIFVIQKHLLSGGEIYVGDFLLVDR